MALDPLECPSCAPGTPLSAATGGIEGQVCRRCRGAFVPGHQAVGFRAQMRPGRPVAGALALPCPSCGAWMAWRVLHDAQAATCGACGGAWLSSSALASETRSVPRSRGSDEPGVRVQVRVAVGVALTLLVVLVAAAVGFSRSRTAPPLDEAVAPSPEAPSRAASASVGRAAPAGLLYGGQPAAWWQQRLMALRGRRDEEGRRLYEATRGRARANGLSITDAETFLRVEEAPDGPRREGARQ